MKKIESIKSDLFKKFEKNQIADMGECKGMGEYSTGRGYYDNMLGEEFLVTNGNTYRMKFVAD